MLLALLIAGGAIAQDSARSRMEAKGDATMEAVKDALAHRKAASTEVASPRLPQKASQAEQQRVFGAIRKRPAMPVIDALARAALASGETRMATERDAQARRLRQALGLEPAQSEALAKAAPAPTPTSWVPVLFVSSSMPLGELRTYAAQLERVHGVLAFRGMPGGLHRVAPMARLAAQILRLDPGCDGPACTMRDVRMIVDPIAFRQHGIARVPALVMIPGDPTQAYCERDEQSPRATHVVFGDSALAGLLDEYARLGGRTEVQDAQALLGAR
jgi:type-F conjugative transfer system pilin assembly protein TrbC